MTTSEIPSHKHEFNDANQAASSSGNEGDYVDGSILVGTGHNPETTSTGGDLPHNNLRPYIVLSIWRRTH